MSKLNRVGLWFKRLITGLLVVIVLVVCGTAWVLQSPSATRWALNTALSKMDNVSIDSINGTLAQRLVLEGIRYHDPELIDASIQRFELIWALASLFKRRLHIKLLDAEGITLDYIGAETDQTDSESSDIPQIPLAIQVDQLNLDQLIWKKADSKTSIDHLGLAAALERQQLSLSNFQLKMPEFSTTGRVQVALQNKWPLTAQLNWQASIQDQAASGQLDLSGDFTRYTLNQTVTGFINAMQSGWINLDAPQPVFDLTTQWQTLDWPLDEKRHLQSRDGKLTVQGTLNDYLLQLTAPMSIDQKSFNVDLDSQGNQQQLIVKQINLAPLADPKSKLTLNASVNWATGLQFLATLNTQQLNPSAFGLEVPARLNSRLQVNGQVIDDQIQADLRIDQLNGEVYDQPVNATGRILVNGKQADFQNVKLSAGRNRIAINGNADLQQSSLDLLIDAPDLRTAWPTLQGRVNGTIHLAQTLEKPQITGHLQAAQLIFKNFSLAQLNLDIDYTHASSRQQSFADLTISDLKLDTTRIDQMTLKAKGVPEAHQANLTINSDLADLNLQFHGDWNSKKAIWLGQVNTFSIHQPQLKRWTLQHPIQLQLSRPADELSIALQHTCLQQNSASICLKLDGEIDQRLAGHIELHHFPLASAQHWLPEDTDLLGSMNAKLSFQSIQSIWQAALDASVADGQLTFADQERNKHQVKFQLPGVSANYGNDQLRALLDLQLTGNDHIDFKLNATPPNQQGDRQLLGSIKADISNLELIEALVPALHNVKGAIKTDLEISGSMQQPQLLGNVTLEQGQLSITQLGTTYENIAITASNARTNPKRFELEGQLESGQGKINVTGYLDLLAIDNMPLHINLKGQKFQISRLSEAEVEVSPDLSIDSQKNLTQVAGSILIDKAKVALQTLPDSAITPSEDEVIINQQQDKSKKTASSMLKTDITIDFGDNAHFSGFGLETDLQGQLNYITKKQQPWMLGRAALSNATYRSYGQDLTIRKGEFLFNGPADNPWLNIEAIRQSNDEKVTAVLALSGQLKSPQTRIYSEPALPESEALAYLVTGKSLKNSGDSEGNAIASAAIGYGVSELSWLSEKLGIDEFEFEEGDKLENSAVRLGQYLNPDLYIGFSLGLFATNYAVDLRYHLNKYFSLATRAGNSQRIELKYHINTD